MTALTIDVNEVFGPTIQGEGPLIGRRCLFVRFARCDLSCSWCDTPYTWDWKGVNGTVFDPALEVHLMSPQIVVDQLHQLDPDCGIVISGGEPMIQRSALVTLTNLLLNRKFIQIETNGRHRPPDDLDPTVKIVASPKLANSGMTHNDRIRPKALTALRDWGASFKFVCESADDVNEVARIADAYDLADVWIMPQGKTTGDLEESTSHIIDETMRLGFNLSPRLHVDLWGGARAT